MDVTTAPTGLTAAEVQERVARGQTNDTGERTSRKLSEIVRANVFTRFNAILGVALAVILVIGPIQDATFGLILIANSGIGIFQEVRAKRKLDQLAVANAVAARVVRDGEVEEVATPAVVLDDLVDVRAGDQIPCDGVVCTAEGLEVDESLLTGESDPVNKAEGDEMMSGSFVVAGSGRFQATKVGPESYAAKLATEARRFQLTRSELMEGINTILRIITWVLIPVTAALLWSQLEDHGLNTALRSTVAGVVAMVPEGLVLLTSIAFMVAALTLARREVLVQELPAVEGLARVDVVCLDKTGTLTEGEIVFDELEALDADDGGAGDEDRASEALGALADDPNRNATAVALAGRFSSPGWTRTDAVPFSSARKWSAASFEDHGSWVMGAPEMVITDNRSPVRARADELASSGRRTLVLARSDSPLTGETLLGDLTAVALVMFAEKVRPDAADTLAYFAAQGVELRVISGDNPRTVAAVAKRVGLDDPSGGFDARELPEDPAALADVLEEHRVFGRVTPQQKRAMVGALQSKGHVVAMTGDGVNDALALKDADIGVAMGSGAAATRAVAQLVLLKGEFSTLPGVVAEGRRVMANIERSANLFVTKTVYAALLAIVVVIASWPYPYLPRHLTIVSTFTIGIPGFFLALAPNSRRYIPGFIVRVLRFCIPAGTIAAAAALVMYGIARYGHDLPTREVRTASALVLIAVALWVLVLQARPFNWWKTILVAAMVVSVALILVIPGLRDFYAVQLPPADVLGEGAIIAGISIVLLEVGWRFSQVIGSRRNFGDVVDRDGTDDEHLVRATPSA
ncbi:MAG TPA: HAD-IC family P-type ATPase [Acidimicrobiia bacterium]|nr:HAD-IC family P-type ATPase [Acidimicrobiia bacterium]